MKFFVIFFLIFLWSCQPIEKIEPVVFDNSQLSNISITASEIEVINRYESKFSDDYIDHSLKIPPINRIQAWFSENVKFLGEENKLEIIIVDASIKKTEIKNTNSKKYQEKEIYKYEIFYLVEYNLYDNLSLLLASTNVEVYRSTTSGKFISLNETNLILDDLIYLALKDFANETSNLFEIYMKDYII
tara:strand:- start:6042 stop:6605 length:564 start_codon:yes stop_codon:yes gene_type:complete